MLTLSPSTAVTLSNLLTNLHVCRSVMPPWLRSMSSAPPRRTAMMRDLYKSVRRSGAQSMRPWRHRCGEAGKWASR